jgi:hypothetical protein
LASPSNERAEELKRTRTEAREATGKIEGIGDVLSDGSKRFLGIVNDTNVINGTKTLKN